MSLDFSTFSSDMNAAFAIPILLRTSGTHLPSDVNILPRWMKLFACFKLVPCMVILHVDMTVDFEDTMVKDLDPFRYNPLISLSQLLQFFFRFCIYYCVISIPQIIDHSVTNSETSLSFNVPHDYFIVQCKQMRRGDTPMSNALFDGDSLTSPLCLTAAC